jgi:4-amino-4-deoxy-L-arabinose transferase-like glycosyltransferase
MTSQGSTRLHAGVAAGATIDPRRRARVSAPAMRRVRVLPELAALLALAAVLDLWALDRNGWANTYYTAAVRSMASSWHAFLYGSFDAAGVMTVDKPPLALWVQALSVRLFGFHPLSVLAPQALMGVASVVLVYDLTRRRFGRAAGTVAGLALALTPITVAISRHNNPDALLVLCCVAALWCTVRALDDGRARWLVAAGVCVGLGFETKMAVALMVVPGIVAAWLWVAPRGRARAAGALAGFGAAMVAVGGAWPLLVALTPAADRPWVSGTSDNSIWSLILDYNGLGRLDGQAGGPQALGGGGPFGGAAGAWRLLNASIGGQAGWLLGLAIVAGVAVLVASRLRRGDPRTGWLLAVGGAFVTTAVAFSAARGIFHPYYVSLLAAFTAALVGAGAVTLVRAGSVTAFLAPLAIAAGVVGELVVIRNEGNAGGLGWAPPLLVMGGIVAAVALGFSTGARLRAGVLAAALGLLLLAPASWAVQTLAHATSGTFPAGGPASAVAGGGPGGGPGGFAGAGGAPPAAFGRAGGGAGLAPPGAGAGAGGFGGGGPGGDSTSLTAAVRYVRSHGGGTIAVSSQSGAAAQIVSSGANVVGLGGFSGRESQVSVSWLAEQVRAGHVRWVLADGGTAGGRPIGSDGRTGSATAMAAVAKTCRAVTPSSGVTLYDCSGKAAALMATS